MNQLRALIVDDSSVMRKIIERSLRQAGLVLAEVLEAANGLEALALLQNHSVDLILSDIQMPVMDGLEFVRQVNMLEKARETPMVLITTESYEHQVAAAIAHGVQGYIRKPFTSEQVKEHILPLLIC